ncbi:PREDICTED: ubiquitin-like protein 7 [Priapulus caudatus]|uniref:Ubiquitin-like protein 7 n=1 Tax=Priapulus caudatus TaxID=37621 RepID=A0ABM1E6X1_PRICU|nr:PREDICTED: ubiquitin-like protein 7 [Priapulus caudatus]
MVHQMLANPKVMANICASTPGLASNPIALGILHDPVLVELLADPTNIQRTIDMHPELYLAIVALASAINEETATAASAGAGPSGSRTDAYSLDRMSDDDDDVAAASAQASQPITSSQLASALASATASGATSQPGGVITTDLFHQAMQQALGLAPGEANADSEMGQVPHGPPTSGQPQSEHEREVQLQTLRDMGITDDAISRRALEVTNGDVQAALELIFGDGI